MIQILQNSPKNSLLSHLLKQAKQHQTIDQLLKAHLAHDLQAHCQAALFEKGILTLHVNNSIWLARIKYALPELIRVLKSYPILKSLQKIQCKVRPFHL